MAGSRKSSGTDPVHLCKALKAVLVGTPELNDGNPISLRKAADVYFGASYTTIQRYAARDDSNAAFHEVLRGMDLEKLSPRELQLECSELYRMRCQKGRPTFFPASEEAGIVHHCVVMGEHGCCLDADMLKATALSVAVLNKPEHHITQKWLMEGVSRDWHLGFMRRHKELLSLRYGEGLEGNRRNVQLSHCVKRAPKPAKRQRPALGDISNVASTGTATATEEAPRSRRLAACVALAGFQDSYTDEEMDEGRYEDENADEMKPSNSATPLMVAVTGNNLLARACV